MLSTEEIDGIRLSNTAAEAWEDEEARETVDALLEDREELKRELDDCWEAVHDACTWCMDGPKVLTIAERIRIITRTMNGLGERYDKALAVLQQYRALPIGTIGLQAQADALLNEAREAGLLRDRPAEPAAKPGLLTKDQWAGYLRQVAACHGTQEAEDAAKMLETEREELLAALRQAPEALVRARAGLVAPTHAANDHNCEDWPIGQGCRGCDGDEMREAAVPVVDAAIAAIDKLLGDPPCGT